MLAGAFAEAAASLAWKYLEWYLERQSIKDDERRKIALEGLERINMALSWKADHPISTNPDDPFSDFLQQPKPDTQSQDNDPAASGAPRSDTDGKR